MGRNRAALEAAAEMAVDLGPLDLADRIIAALDALDAPAEELEPVGDDESDPEWPICVR